MGPALRIAAKDLRQRLRDRSAVMLAVVLPLALAFIFNLVFGSADDGPRPFQYAVVDLDGGPVARGLVGELLPEVERRGFVELRRVGSAEEARQLARDGTIDAAFVVPAGFSAAVQARRPARIDVIGNADAPVGTEVARSIADSYAAELNATDLAVTAVLDGRSPNPGETEALAQRAAAAAQPMALEDVSAAEKILDTKTYFAAGMAVFFLFFTVQFGVISLLGERDTGTLRRLLAAPIPPASILGGKLLTSFLLGVGSVGVLVVATSVLIGADWGNPLGVAILVVTGVLAATGVTAVVTSLARTPDQAASWGSVIGVTLGLLGGAFFPIAQVGGVATTLSMLTPHAWFLRGLGELAGGGGVGSVLPAAGALLVFAAVTGAIAALRLPKAVRP